MNPKVAIKVKNTKNLKNVGEDQSPAVQIHQLLHSDLYLPLFFKGTDRIQCNICIQSL